MQPVPTAPTAAEDGGLSTHVLHMTRLHAKRPLLVELRVINGPFEGGCRLQSGAGAWLACNTSEITYGSYTPSEIDRALRFLHGETSIMVDGTYRVALGRGHHRLVERVQKGTGGRSELEFKHPLVFLFRTWRVESKGATERLAGRITELEENLATVVSPTWAYTCGPFCWSQVWPRYIDNAETCGRVAVYLVEHWHSRVTVECQ